MQHLTYKRNLLKEREVFIIMLTATFKGLALKKTKKTGETEIQPLVLCAIHIYTPFVDESSHFETPFHS